MLVRDDVLGGECFETCAVIDSDRGSGIHEQWKLTGSNPNALRVCY